MDLQVGLRDWVPFGRGAQGFGILNASGLEAGCLPAAFSSFIISG